MGAGSAARADRPQNLARSSGAIDGGTLVRSGANGIRKSRIPRRSPMLVSGQCRSGGRSRGGRGQQARRRRRNPGRHLPARLRPLPAGPDHASGIVSAGQPLGPQPRGVDDPTDANYNRLVFVPYPARTEQMWRQDGLYDALVVIGYNMAPVIPGLGSAIFLHIARPDFSSTLGCVAVSKETLLGLLPLLGPGSTITIRG